MQVSPSMISSATTRSFWTMGWSENTEEVTEEVKLKSENPGHSQTHIGACHDEEAPINCTLL